MTGPTVHVSGETQQTTAPRQSRGLLKRIFVSIAVITTLIMVFVTDHAMGVSAPLLLVVGLSLGYGSTREMIRLFGNGGVTISPKVIHSLVAAVIASAWVMPLLSLMNSSAYNPVTSMAVTSSLFLVCLLVLFASSTHRYHHPGQNLTVLAAETLCLIYIGLLLSTIAQLRWVVSPRAGYLVLTSLIIATKGGDIGAYVFGRILGKEKMTPRLSPAKTWWGFRGALVGSTLFSVLWLSFAPCLVDPNWQRCPLVWSAVYGLLLGLLGVIGDLFESLIKRDLGQKDSSKLMPGLGGLLDILDSVLYAAPVALIAWLFFPPAVNWF